MDGLNVKAWEIQLRVRAIQTHYTLFETHSPIVIQHPASFSQRLPSAPQTGLGMAWEEEKELEMNCGKI